MKELSWSLPSKYGASACSSSLPCVREVDPILADSSLLEIDCDWVEGLVCFASVSRGAGLAFVDSAAALLPVELSLLTLDTFPDDTCALQGIARTLS